MGTEVVGVLLGVTIDPGRGCKGVGDGNNVSTEMTNAGTFRGIIGW